MIIKFSYQVERKNLTSHNLIKEEEKITIYFR